MKIATLSFAGLLLFACFFDIGITYDLVPLSYRMKTKPIIPLPVLRLMPKSLVSPPLWPLRGPGKKLNGNMMLMQRKGPRHGFLLQSRMTGRNPEPSFHRMAAKVNKFAGMSRGNPFMSNIMGLRKIEIDELDDFRRYMFKRNGFRHMLGNRKALSSVNGIPFGPLKKPFPRRRFNYRDEDKFGLDTASVFRNRVDKYNRIIQRSQPNKRKNVPLKQHQTSQINIAFKDDFIEDFDGFFDDREFNRDFFNNRNMNIGGLKTSGKFQNAFSLMQHNVAQPLSDQPAIVPPLYHHVTSNSVQLPARSQGSPAKQTKHNPKNMSQLPKHSVNTHLEDKFSNNKAIKSRNWNMNPSLPNDIIDTNDIGSNFNQNDHGHRTPGHSGKVENAGNLAHVINSGVTWGNGAGILHHIDENERLGRKSEPTTFERNTFANTDTFSNKHLIHEGQKMTENAAFSQSNDPTWGNGAGILHHIGENEKPGRKSERTTFGLNTFANTDTFSNKHLIHEGQTMTENAAFSQSNDPIKHKALDIIQVLPVNPHTSLKPEGVNGFGDSRDIDQATFALLGIEPNIVGLESAGHMNDGIKTADNPPPTHAPANQNSWINAKTANTVNMLQNIKMFRPPLEIGINQRSKTHDHSFSNGQGPNTMGLESDIHRMNDGVRTQDAPPPIHVPVNQNTWINGETVSNMMSMPQGVNNNNEEATQPFSNNNNQGTQTKDISLFDTHMTGNTIKDSFDRLDNLDFGFDNFQEDLVHHNVFRKS